MSAPLSLSINDDDVCQAEQAGTKYHSGRLQGSSAETVCAVSCMLIELACMQGLLPAHWEPSNLPSPGNLPSAAVLRLRA